MKENKDALKGKKAVKCEPVDWTSFKLGREGQTDKAEENKENGEKWAVKGTVEKKQSDKDFNEFVFRELSAEPLEAKKTGDEDASAAVKDEKEKKTEVEGNAGSVDKDEREKKPRKRKSLNTKLDEIGKSNWVSTGNFRNEEKISDQAIRALEDNIIETTRAAQDEILSSAVNEVNKALEDEGGYEPLGEVSLADTFEIPELDIHFGDTEELKGINRISREIKDKDLKKEIEKLDLAQSIEEQTAREIEEQAVMEMAEQDESLKEKKEKRRSGKKTGSKKKASSTGEEIPAGSTEEDRPKKTRRKKTSVSEDEDKVIIKSDELKARRKKKKSEAVLQEEQREEEKPVRRSAEEKQRRRSSEEKPARKSSEEKPVRKSPEEKAHRKSPEEKPVRKSSEEKARRKSSEEKPHKKSSGRKKPAGEPAVKSSTGKTSSGRKKTSDIQKDKVRPIKSAEGKKEGPSEFRKRPADWKDPETVEKAERISFIKQRKEALRKRIRNMTPIQWSMVAMALIIFITGIMTSAVYANYQGEQNKARALASLTQYTEDDSYATATQTVTQEMLPDAVDEPEPVQAKVLSLEMSSVEKDLKIKLVDDQDTLVKDVSWSVTVAKEGEDGNDTGDSEVYEDDDRDGTIYINDIAAGEYAVTLNPSDSLADYILPQDKQLVSVKATIEYKVIANIRDEIKSEKEVNVALEDPNGNQAADVETGSALTDTVEWCESTRTENGEEYVEATPDLTKTASSMKKSGMFAALEKIGRSGRMSVTGKSVLGLSMPAGYTVATAETISGDNLDEEPLAEEPAPAVSSVKIRVEGDTTIPVDASVTLVAETVNCPDGTSVNWDFSDAVLASVNTDGNRCTVVGKQAGRLTVKVTCKKDDNIIAEASCEIVIKEKSDSDPSLSISGSSSVGVNSTVILTAAVTPKDATVSWSSSDESIASIYSTEDGGRKCTVKGIKAGNATITASASNGKTTTMTMTVKEADTNYSDDAKLYDASKNLLYVKEGDNYRPATYGDYKGGIYSVFYRKQGSYLYTGWQNIDGKTYYYTSDHNYVTGEQVIQGVKYNFGLDGALSTGSGTLGIDVSKYQPNINWSAVKASGVNYVIIRCGYRGASTGALIQDPYFTSHIKGAKAAGLKVGVYFFTTALTEAEAVEEASMCAELCSGYGINYPIFMDCENSPRPGYNSMSASERTTIIKAFCNTIKSAGYTPGVYANKTWLSSYINTSALSGCKIWLAQYNSAGPTYSGRYDLWQYTSKGHVDGISGNVDMNQSYLGY